MKKQLLPLLAGIALISFSLFACSKDNDTPAKTKTELLTQTSWKFSSAKAGGLDISGNVDACYKDNVITFSTGGTGTVNEATTICSPSTAGPFTWAFQTNETQLNISAALFQGGSGIFNLVSLTETNLVLSQTVTLPPFPATLVEVTFVH